MVSIDPRSIARIRELRHFQTSGYGDLDIEATLSFFAARYMTPLQERLALNECSVLDCACGYGWLAIAFVLGGARSAVAVDLDLPRLRTARRIAAILGVEDRIQFLHGSVEDLPVGDNGVQVAVSVETLEHVGDRAAGRRAVAELGRVADRAVILTTPNKLFPVIAHDTRLPFLHWLPPRRRRWLSGLLGRRKSDLGNQFLTPSDLSPLHREFRRVSRCLVFSSFEAYRNHYPFYLPYLGTGKTWKTAPGAGQALYYRTVSVLLGTHSHWLMPNLAGVYVRRRAEEDRAAGQVSRS
jgi:SAM-dependent methyltransferase